MKIESTVNTISDEVLAAYLDANATDAECINILDALSDDASLREIMHISQLVDDDLAALSKDNDFLPMTAMAASCSESCTCSLECEKYILRKLAIPYDEDSVITDAISHGWQKETNPRSSSRSMLPSVQGQSTSLSARRLFWGRATWRICRLW